MKDEIKEILDYFKKYVNDKFETYTVVDSHTNYLGILLDYITNLQQKEELLRQEIKDVRKAFNGLQEENKRLKKALCKDNIVPKCKYDYLKRQKEGLELDLFCIKDYKSRIEKAIEYITTEQLYTNYQWGKSQYVKILKDLLNILQGVGKDE